MNISSVQKLEVADYIIQSVLNCDDCVDERDFDDLDAM